jgi:hypothetical protein
LLETKIIVSRHQELNPMQVLSGSVTTLAVTAIYYLWRAYQQGRVQHSRTLHERVAYMLWITATRLN